MCDPLAFIRVGFIVSMKSVRSSLCKITVLVLSLLPPARGADNILLIIADDLGADSFPLTASAGASLPPMPNITALKTSGILFRNACAHPTCSPSRAAMLTGRHPFRTGIGEAIVRKLGADGYSVLGTGRDAGKLQALKDALGSAVAFDFLAADITADDAPKAIVDAAIAKFGRLNLLVNNAGSFNFGPVHATTDAMLDEVFGISLRAPFRLCREALVHMGEGSSIVFIGSTWGLYGTPGGGAYSTVKAGQIGLMQTLAAEYGPKGVRSNYIAPTVVKTGMTALSITRARASVLIPPFVPKLWKARILLRKGDKAAAIATAREGAKIAAEMKTEEYVRLNNEVIALASK